MHGALVGLPPHTHNVEQDLHVNPSWICSLCICASPFADKGFAASTGVEILIEIFGFFEVQLSTLCKHSIWAKGRGGGRHLHMSHLKHEEGMRHGTNSTSTNMINNYLDVPLSATNEGTKVGCSKWSDKNWGIKVKIPSLGDERVGL